MNQKLIIGIIALIVIGGGFGIYASNNSKSDIMKKEAIVQKEKEVMVAKENIAMEQEKQKESMMNTDASVMTPKTDIMVNKDTSVMAPKTETMVNKETNVMVPKTDTMVKVGSYESYDAAKIARASDTHNVVLFFRASWCPTCKALDGDIRAHLQDIPANLTILDVNYDNSTELKKKYGVTYQHTFVQVDAQGALIKKWSGSQTLSSLVAELK